MARKLGMNAKFYRSATLATLNTVAHFESKTWILVDDVRDLTINLETGEADVTTRANLGWRQTLATLKDGTIEFEMLYDTADVDFTAFQTAWLAGSEIAVAAMSGLVTDSDSEGLAGNFVITNFSRNEALEDAIKISVTLKPSSYNNWWATSS